MKTMYRAAVGLLLALGIAAQAAEIRVEPRVQLATGAVAKSKAVHAKATHVKAVRLPPMQAEAKSAEANLPGTPLKIGSGRDIPELQADAVATLTWDDNGASKVAALSVMSPGAVALRAGLRIYSMPAEAKLRFYGPADSDLIEVTGAEILETLARNEAAGDHSEGAKTFWSPSIEAETIVVELELPAATPVASLKVGLPYVTHMTSSVKFASVNPYQSAACEVDATCSIGTWGSQMNSVAHVQFQIGTSGYICTGTLMADQDTASTIPYFLTANHCISDATTAGTVETWWFYRSASCNSTTLNPAVRLTGGATLLYAAAQTDTSFMRLNNAPPAGAVYAGWTVTTATVGAAATAIHHPRGDMEKISFGNMTGHWICTAASGGMFNCSAANAASGTFYELQWTTGITEPGSSGSGVFLDNGKYLIGQLYGGSTTCTVRGSEFYGRLDVAYNARLSTWLGATAQPTLSIVKAGTGGGTVSSSPAGIDCGASCSANFPGNSNIALTAAPAVGSTFTSWSGACTGTSPSCAVVLGTSMTATATFTASPPQTLTVSRVGSGTVTSNPGGINCGTVCSSTFTAGSAVSLSAAPAPGYAFTGWSGGACSGAGLCTVTMNGAVNATANFSVVTTPSIGVTLAGNGSGVVTSTPWSLYCGTLCNSNFAAGQVVTLNASANAGTTFAGWGGACSGTSPTCTLTVNGPLAVTATFNNASAPPPPPPPPPTQQSLTVTKAGTGTGTVTSTPAGVNCGVTCSANFNTGTSVTLTATPASGSTFAGWSGACTGTAACVLPMNAATAATATFTATVTPPPPVTQTLTVTSTGTGTGTVTSNPAGINCGATCNAPFANGTVVTLNVITTSGSTFAGWTGACTGTAPCVVTMNAATSVGATFTLNAPPPPPVGTPSITVTRGGTGSGTVIAGNFSIYCGTLCSANYAAGTSITLTANTNAGSTFGGWGGACAASGTSPSCTLSVTGPLAVSANFNSGTAPPPPPPPPPTQQALTVSTAGTGTGTVTSSTGGINCGTACSANFPTGTMVTLTATPASGSTFTGWSGACSGTSTCALTMNAAASATATFTAAVTPPPPPPPPPSGTPSITVTSTGNGSGVVLATNWSIYCGTLCTANYAPGTAITLNANPNAGSRFTGWSGACSGTAPSCTVTVNSGLAISANFVTP